MSSDTARDRILQAATRLFGQRGFAGTSVREVVDEAEVSKPTLYYYFKNKDSLFRACVQTQLDGLEALVDHMIDEGL